MEVSLAGVASNAVDVIERLTQAIHTLCGENGGRIIQEINPGRIAYLLNEIALHAEITARGGRTIQEFAEHYCLTTAAEGTK